MDFPTVDDFLLAMKEHRIDGIVFDIEGYAHYHDCRIAYVYEDYPLLGKRSVNGVEAVLSRNEKARFYGAINPDEKLFHIKGQGKQSLRFLWKKVRIKEILPVAS